MIYFEDTLSISPFTVVAIGWIGSSLAMNGGGDRGKRLNWMTKVHDAVLKTKAPLSSIFRDYIRLSFPSVLRREKLVTEF